MITPYSSDTHKPPTINVNLKPCDCTSTMRVGGFLPHSSRCAGKPVCIPCPIQPSAVFHVALGECNCFHRGVRNAEPPPTWVHTESCASCPIRVACSIGGKTWEASEVEGIEAPPQLGMDRARLWNICRERWEIVKALVLGKTFDPNEWDSPDVVRALIAQRDAVYAALADIARAETTIIQRLSDIDRVHTNRLRMPFVGVASHELHAFVGHLIEQVGVLS